MEWWRDPAPGDAWTGWATERGQEGEHIVVPFRRRLLSFALTCAALVTVGSGALAASASSPESDASVGAELVGSGCQTTGVYDVCTTNPAAYDDGIDPTIAERLRSYVQAQQTGRILGAMYQWELAGSTPDSKGLINDLIAAHDRGVEVRLVLGHLTEDGVSLNDKAVNQLRAGGVEVTVCEDSCLPGVAGARTGVMHMKFFTFSGATPRVVHTSSNFSEGQYKRHQNLLSVLGDQGLYENYVGYWHRMQTGSWAYDGDDWEGDERAREGTLPGTKSYFFPRTQADPVRGTLEHLSCVAGQDRVWVAASMFRSDTRLPVVEVLDDLADSGCDVRVIVSEGGDQDWVRENSSLPDANVRLLEGEGTHWYGQHNKLIVTNALFDGQPRTAVYAGSHNLNYGSLRRSSDGMLRVTDAGVHTIYTTYYKTLYDLSQS